MEYILKMAEAAELQGRDEQEESVRFKSVYTINGKSILSPLMTPEKRLEMQNLRRAAIAIEEQKELNSQASTSAKLGNNQSRKSDAGSSTQLVDVSTNTELEAELALRPVTIVGRIKQKLELSDILIYDNSWNAIFKMIKPNFSVERNEQHHVLCEEFVGSPQQHAVLKEPSPVYSASSVTSLEAAQPACEEVESLLKDQTVAVNAVKPNPESEEITKTDEIPCRIQTMRQLLGVAHLLKLSAKKRERESLQRSITSPVLRQSVENVPPSDSGADRAQRLHPQLWKRHYSYPLSTFLSGVRRSGEQNTSEEIKPSQVGSCASLGSKKIQVMQQHSSANKQLEPQQHSTAKKQQELQQPTKVTKTLQSKRSSNTKSLKRSPRPPSFTAHACSHANASVQQVGKANKAPMSSTQRRLSYDPHATLKREAALKKVDSNPSCVTRSTSTTSQSSSCTMVAASSSNCSTSDLIKRKLLEEMEQQQRQRFQQLVSQQADEQQRLQKEFLEQQQQLMEQMISDMSTLTYDKECASDRSKSRCSTTNSLPQSRLDLDLDEPEA